MTTRPVVIFMTSNGVGMGHLSRQLTLALSGPVRFESVVFSLSGALPRIMAADRNGELPEARSRDMRYEFCPSRESGWLPPGGWRRSLRSRYRSYRWHPYLRDRLVALVAETQASVVVFDGVMPYEGLVAARSLLPGVKFVWVRRGMWQPGQASRRLRHSSQFDLIIQPGDFGSAADRGPLAGRTDAIDVAPVSLVDVLQLDGREKAKAALGLPPDRPALLLAPGSGALGSIEEVARRVLTEVASRGPEWIVAVTRQSIARHGVGATASSTAAGQIVVLDDVYPLARHLHAFDAAVGAAGYNSVHELLASRIPTLLIPSVHHATDDQAARATGVLKRGAALLPDEEGLEPMVAELLDGQVRQRLTSRCATLEPVDGGLSAADLIGALATRGAPTPRQRARRPPRPWVDARTPTVVDSPSRPLFSESISVNQIHGDHPVEHLVEHSSAAYRADRHQAAAWLYRPQPQPRDR